MLFALSLPTLIVLQSITSTSVEREETLSRSSLEWSMTLFPTIFKYPKALAFIYSKNLRNNYKFTIFIIILFSFPLLFLDGLVLILILTTMMDRAGLALIVLTLSSYVIRYTVREPQGWLYLRERRKVTLETVIHSISDTARHSLDSVKGREMTLPC